MEKKLHEVRSREWFSGLVSENGREYIAILRKNSAGCFSRVVFHEACENRGKLVFTPYPRAVIKSVFDIFIVPEDPVFEEKYIRQMSLSVVFFITQVPVSMRANSDSRDVGCVWKDSVGFVRLTLDRSMRLAGARYEKTINATETTSFRLPVHKGSSDQCRENAC